MVLPRIQLSMGVQVMESWIDDPRYCRRGMGLINSCCIKHNRRISSSTASAPHATIRLRSSARLMLASIQSTGAYMADIRLIQVNCG